MKTIALLIIALLAAQSTRASETYWNLNYNEARTQALETDKLVLIFFTGSDWCLWCQKLERELFSSPSIKTELNQFALPVRLDYPRKNKLPPQQVRQNRVLQKRFEVDTFPTVILLDPRSEKTLLRHHYTSLPPAQYLKTLKELSSAPQPANAPATARKSQHGKQVAHAKSE